MALGAAALRLIKPYWFLFGRLPTPELRTARKVPVSYYLSLPQGWDRNRIWPIIVTVEGVGHDFLGNHRAFQKARGDRPFILVTPFVRSNGKDPADAKAILAIAEEVAQKENGQPKFFLAGFSAGGHVTWQIVASHPERLAGVTLAAANFTGRGIRRVSDSPTKATLPIRAFQGTWDPHRVNMLEPEWNEEVKFAKRNGFRNLNRIIVPRAGHQPFASETLDFFTGLLRQSSPPTGTR